jgi:hypothetical protein
MKLYIAVLDEFPDYMTPTLVAHSVLAARHIEHTITGEQTWDELLPRFEEWLRGVGYVFDGQLEMVKD